MQRLPGKPRLRKTAPTVRQQAEQARTEADASKGSRLGRTRKAVSRLKPPRNKFTLPIFVAGSWLKKIFYVDSARLLYRIIPRGSFSHMAVPQRDLATYKCSFCFCGSLWSLGGNSR